MRESRIRSNGTTQSPRAPSAGLKIARGSPVCNAPSISEEGKLNYFLWISSCHGLCSLDPADLSPLLFALENSGTIGRLKIKMIFPRSNSFFDEDRCMIRNHNAARILAAWNQLVLSLKSSMGAESTAALCDDFVFNLHKAITIFDLMLRESKYRGLMRACS